MVKLYETSFPSSLLSRGQTGIERQIHLAYLITLASLITTALDNTTSAIENDW